MNKYPILLCLITVISACDDCSDTEDESETPSIFSILDGTYGDGRCNDEEDYYDAYPSSTSNVIKEVFSNMKTVGVPRCVSYETTMNETKELLTNYGISLFNETLLNNGLDYGNNNKYAKGHCMILKEQEVNALNNQGCEHYDSVDVFYVHQMDIETIMAIPELAFREVDLTREVIDDDEKCETFAEDVDILKARSPDRWWWSNWFYIETCENTQQSISQILSSVDDKDVNIVEYACGEIRGQLSSHEACTTDQSVLMLKFDEGDNNYNDEFQKLFDLGFNYYNDYPSVFWQSCP